MRTRKIIDTCTMINLFCESGLNISSMLEGYEVITTEVVIQEYTKKYSRKIPECINIIETTGEDREIMDDLELLFPRLGPGERSLYAVMVRMAKQYDKIVMLTDDKEATKKLNKYLSADNELPNTTIIWANTNDFLTKMST